MTPPIILVDGDYKVYLLFLYRYYIYIQFLQLLTLAIIILLKLFFKILACFISLAVFCVFLVKPCVIIYCSKLQINLILL